MSNCGLEIISYENQTHGSAIESPLVVEIFRLVADDEFSVTIPLLLELIALFVEMLLDASEVDVVVAVDVIAVFEDEVVWEIDSWFICELL